VSYKSFLYKNLIEFLLLIKVYNLLDFRVCLELKKTYFPYRRLIKYESLVITDLTMHDTYTTSSKLDVLIPRLLTI